MTRFYGSVERVKRERDDGPDQVFWAIRCESQVMIKLKRTFERIAKNSRRGALLTDTPENCRDLLWFMERYPLEISKGHLRMLKGQCKIHEDLEADVIGILGADYKPREYALAIPPRDYQRVAADLALRRGDLLLADDLGLGKTCTAICTLVASGRLPAVVVTHVHLLRQWESEICKFAPGLRVHRVRSGQPYDLTKHRGVAQPFPDVIVINYHKLAGWGPALAGKVNTVIFDEVQELRHDGTAKYEGAAAIADSATLRMGLSATPIYNFGGELYNVLEVLSPSCLGSLEEFKREWCSESTGYGGKTKLAIKEPAAFGGYLRETGLMLRRTRAEVSRELPALTRVPHFVDADLGVIEKAATAAADLARIILAQGGRGFDKMRAAEELDSRMRQATGIAKAPYVADFVRMVVETDEPVVLYGWHREVYNIWMERLQDLHPVMYTGSESAAAKERAKQAFLAGETKVLIMSLRSGAGLDGLQSVCCNVVHGELDWSPGVHEQCDGRPHRDGQKKPVTSYYLLAECGSDPTISETLNLKKVQVDGIRTPDDDGDENKVVTGTVDLTRVQRLAEAVLAQTKQRGRRDVVVDNEEAA